jgi:hypothetical protein
MAWSSAALSSDETAWAAADYPLMAIQAIPLSPTLCKWVEEAVIGANDITVWVDRTDSNYPSRRAYDGLPGYVTKPSGAVADDVWYFCFDMAAAGIEFDSVFILNHNFHTANGGSPITGGLTLEISDDNDWAAFEGPFSSSPTTGDRIGDLDIHHTGSVPLRYSGVRYARLKISNSGNGNIVPEIGELFLGRRYQLASPPLNPFDPDALFDEQETTQTAGGIHHTTVFHRRRFELNAEYLLGASARAADAKAFFQNCRTSFVWIWEPNTDATAFQLMKKPEFLSLPSAGWTERSWKLESTEQGPETYFLDQE